MDVHTDFLRRKKYLSKDVSCKSNKCQYRFLQEFSKFCGCLYAVCTYVRLKFWNCLYGSYHKGDISCKGSRWKFSSLERGQHIIVRFKLIVTLMLPLPRIIVPKISYSLSIHSRLTKKSFKRSLQT